MQPYLAIFKRDASAQPFGVPAPLFLALVACLVYVLSQSIESGFAGLFLLSVTFVSSTKLVENLSLAHSHSLAFCLPNFKNYQFNYVLGLSLAGAVASSVVLSGNLVAFVSLLSVICCLLSFIYLLVNKPVVKTVAVLSVCMILGGLVQNTFGQKGQAKQWLTNIDVYLSGLSDVYSLLILCSLILLSIVNIALSRRWYLQAKELDPNLAPTAWQTMQKPKDLSSNQIQLANLLPKVLVDSVRKSTHKLDSLFNFGVENSALETAAFGDQSRINSTGSVWLMTLLVTACSLVSHFVFERTDYGVTVIMIYVVLLFMWSNISATLDFVRAKPTLAHLWLWTGSQDRKAYMMALLLMLIKRSFRTVFVALMILAIAGLLIGGGKTSLKLMAFVVIALVCCSFLQLSFNILISHKLRYSMGTRQLTAWLAMLNFCSLVTLFYYSITYSKLYAAGYLISASIILAWCIYYWRNNALEFQGQ